MARESPFPPLYPCLLDYPVDLYIGMLTLDQAMQESSAPTEPNPVEQAFLEIAKR